LKRKGSFFVKNTFFSARQDLAEKVGLPLGNLTSQLLVNIYMHEFDTFVKQELTVKYYIRYADDFVVLSRDRKYLEEVLVHMETFLREKLKLAMHPDKVYIKTYASGVDFLGWVHFPHHRVLRGVTRRRMVARLTLSDKKEVQNAYRGMLEHGDTYKLKNTVDL
jgi:RNA-directed DNA polymerase